MYRLSLMLRVIQFATIGVMFSFHTIASSQSSSRAPVDRSLTVVLDASKSMCSYYGLSGNAEIDQVMNYLESVVGDFAITEPLIYELSSSYKTFSSFQNVTEIDKKRQLYPVKGKSLRQYTRERCPKGVNAFPHAMLDELLLTQKNKPVSLIYVSDSIMPDVAMREFSANISRWLNAKPMTNRLELLAVRSKFHGEYYREEPNTARYEILGGTRPLYIYWFYTQPWKMGKGLAEALQARFDKVPTTLWKFGPWFLDVNEETKAVPFPSPRSALNEITTVGSDGKEFASKDDCVFVTPDRSSAIRPSWLINVQLQQGACRKNNAAVGKVHISVKNLLPEFMGTKYETVRVEVCNEENGAVKTCVDHPISAPLVIDIPPTSLSKNVRVVRAVVTPSGTLNWGGIRKQWSADRDDCDDRQGRCSILVAQYEKSTPPHAATNLEKPLSRTLRMEDMLRSIVTQSRTAMESNWRFESKISVSAN